MKIESMIKLIDDIDIVWKNNQPQGCCIYNRTWQKIALKQGDMDGACAVYSLMMYLILLKVLTYSQVTNLNTSFKGQTSKGRLFKEFFEKEGLCRSGFYFSTIEDKLRHSFSKEVSAVSSNFNSSAEEQSKAIQVITEAIDANAPIMIAEVFKGGGAHAILVVGYELRNGKVVKLFCLDPAYPITDYSYWNTIIRLNDEIGKTYLHISISDKQMSNIYIDEILKIIKR